MHVRIYTRSGCPYSAGARRLLDERGLPYEDVNVTEHPERREEMIAVSGGRDTFPQVFLGDRHVGGLTELQALDRAGGLRDAGADAQPAG